MTKEHEIIFSYDLHTAKDDFSGRIEGDKYALPADMRDTLDELKLTTAEQLHAYLEISPIDIAARMGWTLEGTARAQEKLGNVLNINEKTYVSQPTAKVIPIKPLSKRKL